MRLLPIQDRRAGRIAEGWSVPQFDQAITAIETLRRDGAKVHCITNTVAQGITANVLLACGATPSMTFAPQEAADFTAASDALLVNLGTLDETRREAIPASLKTAAALELPVVLDPVKCELSPTRAEFARHILATNLLTLKANHAEQSVLGDAAAHCRIITGATDRILVDGKTVRVENGHPLMDRVVAVGCALGALVAALGARAETSRSGALAALMWFGTAGELAAANASGPGSYEPAFIDALYSISVDDIAKRARIS